MRSNFFTLIYISLLWLLPIQLNHVQSRWLRLSVFKKSSLINTDIWLYRILGLITFTTQRISIVSCAFCYLPKRFLRDTGQFFHVFILS